MLESFHFLRPWWLLALIPAAVLLWLIWRAGDSNRQWKKIIAPHLLPHLIGDPAQKNRLRPFALLIPIWLITIVAVAGPSWEREPSPFASDSAGLVVVLKASETMRTQDIQPSRMQRAAQKIGDLMAGRKGTKTALIAYAGSAHLVMPLTEDSDIIASMAAEISPDIMLLPEGDATSEAVRLGLDQLTRSNLPGSILLVTDSVDPAEIDSTAESCKKENVPLHVYAVAAPPEAEVPSGSPPAPALDRDSLSGLSRAGGGSLITITPDATDIEDLAKTVTTQFGRSAERAEAEGEQWKDFGYWLVLPLIILSLFWSRPGWSVRWPTRIGETAADS